MQRKLALSIFLIVGTVAAAVTGAAVVAANSEYDMSVVGAIDTPTETANIEGDTFEIDEIGVVKQGETIEVDVSAPDEYDVLLYNTNEKIEDSKDSEDVAANRVRFDSDGLEPGTYMLLLQGKDDGRQAITPVVIQGYDLSLEYPSTAKADGEVTIDATVEPVGNLDQPDMVKVAIWNDDTVTEVPLKQTEGYSATEDLELGTYDVYGAVVGDETVKGYETLRAVTDGNSLSVIEDDDERDGEDENGKKDNGAVDNGNETNDTETDIDNERDAENEEDESGDESDEQPEGSDSANESKGGTDGDNSVETGDNDDESGTNVIEPNETNGTESDETTAPDDVGSPTGMLAVIAISTLLVIANRFDH